MPWGRRLCGPKAFHIYHFLCTTPPNGLCCRNNFRMAAWNPHPKIFLVNHLFIHQTNQGAGKNSFASPPPHAPSLPPLPKITAFFQLPNANICINLVSFYSKYLHQNSKENISLTPSKRLGKSWQLRAGSPSLHPPIL